MTQFNVEEANAAVAGQGPDAVIAKALELANGQAIVSTNFRPGEAAILHLVTKHQPDIPVLWVDHGYNTPDTYRFAQQVIDQLSLNVKLYIPRVTTAYRDAVLGGIPSLMIKQPTICLPTNVNLNHSNVVWPNSVQPFGLLPCVVNKPRSGLAWKPSIQPLMAS